MAYVRDGRELVADAFAHGYILPAFNVCSAEMVRACVEAAAALSAPLILQTYPSDIEQIPPRQMVALVRSFAEEHRVPVLLHLDHGSGFEMALECLRAGYGSVMYDGAGRPFSEVVREAARLSEVAHLQGASVEVAAESFNAGADQPSRAEDVIRLFEEGNVDMVAVSVGSAHGRPSALDLALLSDIADAVHAPLVLHGGSGIPAEDLAAARSLGVVKANIGSALYRALRACWTSSAEAANHREVYARARSALAEVARDKLTIMGALGRARG